MTRHPDLGCIDYWTRKAIERATPENNELLVCLYRILDELRSNCFPPGTDNV